MAEKGGGGDVEPATSTAGGMCDRFLTFLAKNLSVSRMKSIAADSPSSRNNGSAGDGAGHPPLPEVDDDGVDDEDEFVIPIERAEFGFGHGDGTHSGGGGGGGAPTTILEESAAPPPPTPAATDGGSQVAAGPAAAEPAVAVAPVEEESTKVRRTVTIKDDRPAAAAQDGGGSSATAAVERKKSSSSLFGRKRQASSSEERVPRRSGLRPRMPQVPRVPSNINERSSTFIQERRKSFGGGGGKSSATEK